MNRQFISIDLISTIKSIRASAPHLCGERKKAFFRTQREPDLKGKNKKEMPRGRIELPSKDYPSHAWSYV
jgi:hypothetical protein